MKNIIPPATTYKETYVQRYAPLFIMNSYFLQYSAYCIRHIKNNGITENSIKFNYLFLAQSCIHRAITLLNSNNLSLKRKEPIILPGVRKLIELFCFYGIKAF